MADFLRFGFVSYITRVIMVKAPGIDKKWRALARQKKLREEVEFANG